MSRSIRMELPSLAKEGWTRHQVNGPVPLKSAARSVSPIGRNIKNGVVRSTSDNRWLEPTTLPCFALSGSHSLRSCPSAPAKEASRHFLNGRSHPSLSKEGTPAFPSVVFNAPCVQQKMWDMASLYQGGEFAFKPSFLPIME